MVARFFIENGKIFDSDVKHNYFENLICPIFELEENIWFCHGELPLFEKHISILNELIINLNLKAPAELTDPKEILRITKRLINKNKAFKSGWIALRFIWFESKINFFIFCTPSDYSDFPLPDKSLLFTFSEEIKYSKNQYNQYRFANTILWNTTQLGLKGSRFDGAILLNEKNELTECIASNLFFVKEDILITPSVETGCYIDPVRSMILEGAVNSGLKVLETSRLNKFSITEMDEAFTASEARGIQKIMGIESKRFTHQSTVLIYEAVNRILVG